MPSPTGGDGGDPSRELPDATAMKAQSGRSLWRHADFLKLWSAQAISQLGTEVTLLALPLTAVLVLHATPFQVGLLSSAEFVPFLLVGLPAGVWVDRLPRRPILILGDLGRVIALGSVPLAAALDALSMAQLYVVAFVTGICTVFFDLAYQSYLPSLVDRERLQEGNAKLEISRSAAELAGPAIGGGLVQLFTAPIAILADAASYLGSAVFVGWIRRREEHHAPAVDGERPSMRSQIVEGLRYVLRQPLLRPIAACTSISNLFGSMSYAILVFFAVRELGLRPGAIGLVFAVGNIGVLGAALVAERLPRRTGLGRAIIGAVTASSLGVLVLPLATRATAFPVLATAVFLSGAGSVIYNVNQVSLRQAITPDRTLGRMNATMRFLVWGTLPIGSAIGGALGSLIGLRPTLWIAGAGGFLCILPPLLSPVRNLRTIDEALAGYAPKPDVPGKAESTSPDQTSGPGEPQSGS